MQVREVWAGLRDAVQRVIVPGDLVTTSMGLGARLVEAKADITSDEVECGGGTSIRHPLRPRARDRDVLAPAARRDRVIGDDPALGRAPYPMRARRPSRG